MSASEFATPTKIVIRPRVGGSRLRDRWRRSLYVLPLFVVGILQSSLDRSAWFWVICGCVIFLVIVYALFFECLGHASLGIVDGAIVRTAWLRRPKVIPLSGIDQVVVFPLKVHRLDGSPHLWALFLGPTGETRIRAYAEYYPDDELDRFRAATQLPWNRTTKSLTPAQARRVFPESFSWPWAHYVLTCLGVLVVMYLIALAATA